MARCCLIKWVCLKNVGMEFKRLFSWLCWLGNTEARKLKRCFLGCRICYEKVSRGKRDRWRLRTYVCWQEVHWGRSKGKGLGEIRYLVNLKELSGILWEHPRVVWKGRLGFECNKREDKKVWRGHLLQRKFYSVSNPTVDLAAVINVSPGFPHDRPAQQLQSLQHEFGLPVKATDLIFIHWPRQDYAWRRRWRPPNWRSIFFIYIKMLKARVSTKPLFRRLPNRSLPLVVSSGHQRSPEIIAKDVDDYDIVLRIWEVRFFNLEPLRFRVLIQSSIMGERTSSWILYLKMRRSCCLSSSKLYSIPWSR